MGNYIDREKVRQEACNGCTHRIGQDGCGWPEPCGKLIAAFLNAEPSNVAPVAVEKCKKCGKIKEVKNE